MLNRFKTEWNEFFFVFRYAHNAISMNMSKCRENESNERQRLMHTGIDIRQNLRTHLLFFAFIFFTHHHCYLIDSIMTFQQHAEAYRIHKVYLYIQRILEKKNN